MEDQDISNDDLDDKALVDDDVIPQLLQEANSTQDLEDVASGISQLTGAGIITSDLTDCLTALHRLSFKKRPGTSISMFERNETSKGSITKCKHCLFVETKHEGKALFINKTTAVWLLQEGERVSSDRLFQVRSKQSYGSVPQPLVHNKSSTHPIVSQTLEVGNICVIKHSKSNCKFGSVLHFPENQGLSAVS